MIKQKTVELYDSLNLGEKYTQGMSMKEICDENLISRDSLHQYFIVKGIKTRVAKRRECLRKKPTIGEKFGLWTVVSDEVKAGRQLNPENKNRSLHYLVQCKCGKLSWKSNISLRNGTCTRCKNCGNKNWIDKDQEYQIHALILSKFSKILNNIKTRKKVRKLPFTITVNDLNSLYLKDSHCKLSGLNLSLDLSKALGKQNLSIDRIDSNKGYILNNIQLVDKRINMMKGTLPNEEFINLCKLVALNN